MKIYWKRLFISLLFVGWFGVHAQTPDKELKILLNEGGSHYLKATFTGQIWGRYNETNPGSTIAASNASAGFSANSNTWDIGLRRVRSQFFGKISDKVFIYAQVGINNFNYNAARKPGIFFHDVAFEYQITQRNLQLGMGLTGWSGLARFSSPAVASILSLDAPLYQQTTNDVNDQFLRKFSVYGKGKLGKLDYRLVISDPMLVSNSPNAKPLGKHAEFSLKAPHLQSSAYLMYQFLQEESNLTPYNPGTYLGKKRVFNLGVGYQYQKDAIWRIDGKDTLQESMLNLNADLYYDAPLGKNGAAISTYLAFTHLGFGKDYLRGLAIMNPTDANSTQSIAGGGNAIPLYGTGNVAYFQLGYLLPNKFTLKNGGRFQPYFTFLNANYIRLNTPVKVFDFGLNYFVDQQRAKLSLGVQNRPVFGLSGNQTSRKNSVILQLQFAI